MAVCESNRRSRPTAGVLLNTTNYVGLSRVERRLAKAQTSPSYKPTSGSRESPQVPRSFRKRLPVWELKVKGATVVLENLPQEWWRQSLKIRTGQFYDVKKDEGKCSSVTPMKARALETTVSQAFRRTNDSEEKDVHLPRSISVEPDPDGRSLCSSQALGVNTLLAGRPVIYTARKDSAAAYRSKMRDRSPLITPSRRRRADVSLNYSVLQITRDEESPTKKLYRRMLQRASDQIERENFRGWE